MDPLIELQYLPTPSAHPPSYLFQTRKGPFLNETLSAVTHSSRGTLSNQSLSGSACTIQGPDLELGIGKGRVYHFESEL